MKALDLQEILDVIGGKVIFGNEEFIVKRVRKKPKAFTKGTLYFHFGKKNEIYQHNQGKQSFVVVSEELLDAQKLGDGVTLVQVKNIKKSYNDFLDYYRSLFNIPVVGVTGTAGKTTTKEMLTHILSIDRKVQATKRSYNATSINDKYLLGIDDKTEAAVIEMGVAYPGNLQTTGSLFKPQVGIITNIGIAHIEGCKSFKTYFNEKAHMLKILSNNGKLILNGDDENIKLIDLSPFKGTVLFFGQGESCNYRASNIMYSDNGMKFQLNYGGDTYHAFVPGLGHHTVYNALAVIAAAHSLGLEIDEILDRLKSYKHLERHNIAHIGLNRALIINDTWNSNPTSAYAALKVLQEVGKDKKTIAILGKLQRLGTQEKAEYLKMGEYMAKSGIDVLVTVGEDAKLMGQVAIDKGMDSSRVYFASSAQELEDMASQVLSENTVVLLKMSLDKMHLPYHKAVKKICNSS
ncbi:UDP-N-acetylmuramoyl-tripeptide--D-alanyl-D-alanine ligase [Desulfitispora alkaliphila]|uniref:UDP-N-acetylmuramoyl-tripeptide--D-alanyl-D- alanine ligase n=1 Tax=Desulfitispora alkaliphila TaxID=622674 RepID=UPI003D243B6E